jgi:hypothetical protein
MRSIIKDRKGELTDMLIFMITIFILATGMFIMMFVVPMNLRFLPTSIQ